MSSFSLSPAVTIREIDLSGIVPAVATTVGAIGGVFQWGPVENPQLVGNEVQLVSRFGRPSNLNAETFFTAASFLAYSNSLYVSRAVSSNAYNASTGEDTVDIQIKNRDDYTNQGSTINANTVYLAKWPGAYGNSLKISVCDSPEAFSENLDADDADNSVVINFEVNSTTATIEVTNSGANGAAAEADADNIISHLQVGDLLEAGNTEIGFQYLRIASISAANTVSDTSTVTVGLVDRYRLSEDFTGSTVNRLWEYFDLVDRAPGTTSFTEDAGGSGDELHVVVIDAGGKFTGTKGSVLEIWQGLSRATDARGDQGNALYYVDVLNNSSEYVWFGNHRAGYSVGEADTITPINTIPYTERFEGGTDSDSEIGISLSNMARAYDQYKSGEDIDVSLLITGKSRFGLNGEGLANYLIDNIAHFRRDCVVFLSPEKGDVVQNPGNEGEDVVAFRQSCRFSSYAFMDSGYKYMYDRYNDVFRWIPLNGDTAGTVVRTADVRDPWYSPAGFNRGHIKNIVRLAWNPDKTQRDLLYKNDVNPVTTFPNQGTVLFGDKTMLGKPSAFDRINVRRLFIVLQKAISTASKFILFEFNDEFTRAQFRNLVEPYLRDVQGRRGITDFRVVCDETNNTGEVIDRNEFIGDIYIKPARSINFIRLNFVAVRTGVEFEEVIGSFG